MIQKIASCLYRVEIPLPHNPLKSTNSYFIKAPEHNLIIDTGLNLPECKEAFLSAAAELEIDLKRTDFYATHFHVDHLELAPFLAPRTSKIYLNAPEAALLRHPSGWEIYRAFCLKCGFPEDELQKMDQSPLTQGFKSEEFRMDFVVLKENDILHIGDYTFRIIETPGHTPGHTCLYEPDKKILVSGDHVLFDITPNITGWPSMDNSLKVYLQSLEKIYSLDVALVLPGHRSIMNNHRKRIQELKEHHRERAAEVLAALGNEVKTAYQIAPRVSWDITYESWEEFPTPQKFFATGEVTAHLNYLEGEGKIRSMLKNGQVVFSRENIAG